MDISEPELKVCKWHMSTSFEPACRLHTGFISVSMMSALSPHAACFKDRGADIERLGGEDAEGEKPTFRLQSCTERFSVKQTALFITL